MPPVRPRQALTTGDGFTLIELVVVMAVAGVLMGIGLFGFVNWQTTAQQRGSASALVSTLRNASERAVSEGRTYCVDIAGGKTYTVWRYACGTGGSPAGTPVSGTFSAQSSKVSMSANVSLPATPPPCPTADKCLYFYPRGTALQASVDVTSASRSRVYTVHVEGLTARVWM